MVCVVLGFDGLEFELVEEFSLRYLKQKAHCKTSLEDYPVASTPLIWSSILVGRPLEGLMKKFMETPRSLRFKRSWWMEIIRKIVPRRIRTFIGDELITQWIPRVRVSDYLKENNISTILDETESWSNGILGYDMEKGEARESSRWIDALGNEEEEKKILTGIRKEHEERANELFKVLEKKDEYSLIFYYDNWLDIAGHVEWRRKAKIMNKYLEVNSMVKKVSEELSLKNGDVLYVISDHGMKLYEGRGDHSDYGFFSSSTGEKIEKPYEIYFLLKEKIRS